VLIDKTHIRWGMISAGVLVVATGGYFIYASQAISGPSGGSVIGLLYGIAASLMMIFAGLLAVRSRFPTVRCGSAQFWLRGHLWLGALSFVFALFHCNFRFGSTLESTLLIVFIVVVASGVYGLVLQQFLPRLLSSLVPLETFNQQVPFLCRRLQAESDVIVAELCGKIDCDYESISDAAYNLADSMGKLRNGKEGQDFQKFVEATYLNGGAAKILSSKVVRTEVATAPKTGAAPTGKSAKKQTDKSVSKSVQADSSANTADDSTSADAKPDKPMSKLEMARAAAGKKTTEQAEPDKPMSKLEMARAAAGKKKTEQAEPPSPEETKPPQATMPSVQRKTDAATEPAGSRKAAQATMTTETFSVRCPNCSRELVLPDRSFLGRFARCPQCSKRFVLAMSDDSDQPAPPVETAPENPPSKLEQARAAAAANPKQKNVDAKTSPLDKMKAAAAAKKGDATPSSKAKPAKPVKGKPAKGKPLPKKEKPVAEAPIPRTDILKQFYLTNVRPFLAYERSLTVSVKQLVTPQMFAITRNNLPPTLHAVMNQLQASCDERQQFLTQQRLHRFLHSWLLVHIPASIALFVLFIVHVVVALRVIPWTP